MSRGNHIPISLVIIILSSMLVMGQTSGAMAVDCVDFEDPPISSPDYLVGDSLADSGSTVTFIQFEWYPSGWTSGGFASILLASSWCDSGGSGQELVTNNINAKIDFPEVLANGLTVRFAEHGGNVNIGIDGVHTNVQDFAAIDGTTIAGVLVTCTGVGCSGSGQGELILRGMITELYIGGQEFCIDDVCIMDEPLGWGTPGPVEASVYQKRSVRTSGIFNTLSALLLAAGVAFILRMVHRNR